MSDTNATLKMNEHINDEEDIETAIENLSWWEPCSEAPITHEDIEASVSLSSVHTALASSTVVEISTVDDSEFSTDSYSSTEEDLTTNSEAETWTLSSSCEDSSSYEGSTYSTTEETSAIHTASDH